MNSDAQLRRLISAMLDESISDSELKELDDLLLKDSEAREIYRRMIDMHFTLNENGVDESADILSDMPNPENMPETFFTMKKRLFLFQAVAALLAVMFILSLLFKREGETVTITKEVVIETVPKVILAEVTMVEENIKWKSHPKKAGETVYNEVIEIISGELTLTYEHGAVIKIKGPARYELHSLDRAEMKFGQLAAKIPEAAQGFTIDAPKAAIVDLGTEFALNVTTSGKSQVHVYDGEVESSLLGDDGSTYVNARLYKNDSVEIDSKANSVGDITEKVEFIKIEESDFTKLSVSDEFVKMVKQAKPEGYWRFENEKNRMVKNEMSETYSGRLIGKAYLGGGSFVVNKGSHGAMIIDQPLKAINQNGYTIELWLNPAERGHEMALASLVEPEPLKEKQVYQHITHIQLMSRTRRLRHRPFDFRYSHRYPATENVGKNVFAGEAYQPGVWYHLVCVKGKNSISLYLNGELKQTVKDPAINDPLEYQLFIGQLDPIRPLRQFIGRIDELAIYSRPLSKSEIVSHYQAVK